MPKFVLNPNWMKSSGMDRILERKFEVIGLFVQYAAGELAPYDTGNLATSITHEVIWENGDILAEVGTNVEYAWYMEFGTGEFNTGGRGREGKWRYKAANGRWYTTTGAKPQPFLYPAIDLHKREIRSILRKS